MGDRLPYLGHLDEVTLKTRDGLLVQTIHLRGFPFETSSDDELNYRKAMRETLLRGAASSRLAIYHHVVRRRVNTEFDSAARQCLLPPAGRCLARPAGAAPALCERHLPDSGAPAAAGRRGLHRKADRRSPGEDAALLERELRQLHATRETFLATLAPYGPRTLSLYQGPTGLCSEPAEFLSLLANGVARRVLAPSGDMGQTLANRRLSFGFDAMEFGASRP